MRRAHQIPAGDGHNPLSYTEGRWHTAGPAAGSDVGESAELRAPGILCLHGVTRHHGDWWPVAGILGQRQPTIWGLDFRGHGRSDAAPHAEAYHVRDYVHDAVACLRAIATPEAPVILMGHSLGAMVAALAAGDEPNLVCGLVLEDPPFATLGADIAKTPFYEQFCGIRDVLASNRRSQGVAAVADALGVIPIPQPDGKSLPLHQLRDAAALRWMAHCLMTVDPAVLTPLIGGQWMDGVDLITCAQSLRCPTLLLAADVACGGMLQPYEAQRFTQAARDCLRVDLPGVGHLVHGTQTELFLRIVWPFLMTITSGKTE